MPNRLATVAEALFSSGCLKFGRFTLKSGAPSPYYIDLTLLLSSPRAFTTLADVAAETIRELAAGSRIDKLATIELKGALILPAIGCRVDLPCIVVRKEQKKYGATGRVAGAEVTKDDHILFFDDVISDGLSKLEALKPLQESGAQVESILVIVDREQHGPENLGKLGYKVHALVTVTEVAQRLLASNRISLHQATAVLDYVKRCRRTPDHAPRA